jgi:hypothetical protein
VRRNKKTGTGKLIYLLLFVAALPVYFFILGNREDMRQYAAEEKVYQFVCIATMGLCPTIELRMTLTPTPTKPPPPPPPPGAAGGAGGQPGAVGAVPPSANNCGHYSMKNPMGMNFGDPACDFSKDKLFTLLKQLAPADADIWFNQVAPCESSYNPNALQDPAVAVDGAGAWGLFQMGRGKNGPLDHGDVVWGLQAQNAIGYNAKLGGSWRYWACARSHWG